MTILATATPRQLADAAAHKARMARIEARAWSPAPEPQPEPPAPPIVWPWIPSVETTPGRVTIDQIKAVICRDFGLTRGELIASRRTAKVVRARQMAMYLARELTLRSLPEIGRMFGKRDHSTAHYAIEKMKQLIAADPEFAGRIYALRRELGEGE